MKQHLFAVLFVIVLLGLLAGCDRQQPAETTNTATPQVIDEPVNDTTSPATPDAITTTPPAADNLVPIEVLDVRVEVGVGSPIPVTVQVAGSWPGLCAQLATIDQQWQEFQFDISLLAYPGDPDCPPDFMGLPFGIALPINVVELPEGTYTVNVNGRSASFVVPVTPTVPIDPNTGAPLPGGQPVVEGICPELPRPALALFIPGESYLITDPLSGAECYTTLAGEVPGLFQAAGDAVYFTSLQDDSFVVKQVHQDGAAALLSFTAVDREDALLHHSFVVSADGRRIAWSAAGAGPNFNLQPVSNMWLAGIEGNDVVSPLPEMQSEGEQTRALAPVRFSADNSTLYYTLQPIGLGGIWSSFYGRYDNLYALRLNTDAAPILIFDCADHGLFLCLGDFYEVEGQVGTLAYVDGSSVVILNGAGTVLNTLTADADYVGFPTFGPGGELVYYTAELSQTTVMPEQGTIYRVAPATAPAEALASDPGLLPPQAWLDATHVVVAYTQGNDNWGTAVLSLDGALQVMASQPNASFVAVLPAPGPATPR